MSKIEGIVIREERGLKREELWLFYLENNCCETRYPMARATSVLPRCAAVVTARDHGKLVGIARAISDGLSAQVMELSVALSHQGPRARHGTAAVVEDDPYGVGRRLARVLVDVLRAQGVDWIEGVAWKGELATYEAAGFTRKDDHRAVFVDRRPPLTRGRHRGGRQRRSLSSPGKGPCGR
jgi:hypothetical protein